MPLGVSDTEVLMMGGRMLLLLISLAGVGKVKVSQSVGWLSDVLKSSVFSWRNKHACVLTVFLLIMQLTAGWLQEQRKSQTYNIQIVRGTAANGGFLIAVKPSRE